MYIRYNERDEPMFLGMGTTFVISREDRDQPEIILPRDIEHNCSFDSKPGLGFKHAVKARKKPEGN